MKNQYFGDVNDYRKYGLLRLLAHAGLKIGVCWMLTEDGRKGARKRNGEQRRYLGEGKQQGHWQDLDALFTISCGRPPRSGM